MSRSDSSKLGWHFEPSSVFECTRPEWSAAANGPGRFQTSGRLPTAEQSQAAELQAACSVVRPGHALYLDQKLEADSVHRHLQEHWDPNSNWSVRLRL